MLLGSVKNTDSQICYLAFKLGEYALLIDPTYAGLPRVDRVASTQVLKRAGQNVDAAHAKK